MEEKSGFVKMPNSLCRSQVSPLAQKVYAYLASYNPSFPSYSEISRKTKLTDKSITKAIAELLGRGMVSYQQGNFCGRKANEYRVHPKENWRLDITQNEAIAIGRPIMASKRKAGLASERDATSLSNGKYKKNKKQTNYKKREEKVVSLTTEDCRSLGARSLGIDNTDVNEPLLQRQTELFVKKVHRELNGGQFLSNIPSLVEEYVAQVGHKILSLDQILNEVIQPKLYGQRGSEFFAKLKVSVTTSFEAGLNTHKLANETSEQRSERIQREKEATYRRLEADGAIEP